MLGISRSIKIPPSFLDAPQMRPLDLKGLVITGEDGAEDALSTSLGDRSVAERRHPSLQSLMGL